MREFEVCVESRKSEKMKVPGMLMEGQCAHRSCGNTTMASPAPKPLNLEDSVNREGHEKMNMQEREVASGSDQAIVNLEASRRRYDNQGVAESDVIVTGANRGIHCLRGRRQIDGERRKECVL